MTHISLGVSLGLSLELLLGGSLQTTNSRGEETAGDHGSHVVGSDWLVGGKNRVLRFFGTRWFCFVQDQKLAGIVVLKAGGRMMNCPARDSETAIGQCRRWDDAREKSHGSYQNRKKRA